MHEMNCPSCSKLIKFKDEHIGKTMKCGKCGNRVTLSPAEVVVEEEDSPLAGAAGTPPASNPFQAPPAPRKASREKAGVDSSGAEEKKYPRLRVIAIFFRIMALFALVIGGVGACVLLLSGTGKGVVSLFASAIAALLPMFWGVIGAVWFLLISELIYLLIDVEKNSRDSTNQLREISALLRSRDQ